MNEKFFSELTRRLRYEDIATGPVENSRLPVLLSDQDVMWVDSQGCIVLAADAADDSVTAQIYETVRDLCSPVYEYNGVVLAGHELEQNWGYQFVTWRRSLDGASLDHGNYYINGYEEAKLNFAVRAGLVPRDAIFTEEQLAETYRCVHETLESGYPITIERERVLKDVCAQIQRGVPDLDDRVMLSNEKELAAAQIRLALDAERHESIEIYWQDLTPAKQQEILQAFGENGNYDVFPIATLDVPEEDETFSEPEQDQAPGMGMEMAP